MSSLFSNTSVHIDKDVEIVVRPPSHGPGSLTVKTQNDSATLHLWGDAPKRLLKALVEAGVETWEEVRL